MEKYVEDSHEYRYTYDKRGNLTLEENCERTTQGNKWITEATYAYNAANRLSIGTNAKGEKKEENSLVQIYRRFKWKCFEFSCPQFIRVHGKANLTLGIGLRRLTTCDEKDFWELKQEGVAQKILSWLPLMDYYPRPCYQVYLNNLKVGKSKSTHNSTQTLFTVNNDTFELFLHGDNYISVLKNDIQVALLRRDEKIIQETAIYSGHFSIKHISLSFLLLLVEYVDVTWFPMSGYASAKVSRTDISEDEPFKDRVHWVPEDN